MMSYLEMQGHKVPHYIHAIDTGTGQTKLESQIMLNCGLAGRDSSHPCPTLQLGLSQAAHGLKIANGAIAIITCGCAVRQT